MKKVLFGAMCFIHLLINGQEINPAIQEIVNNVNIDSLQQTIKEFSGEIPIMIDGKADTIKSRYCKMNRNNNVHSYLHNRFEKYGLNVEDQSFLLEKIVDIEFCNEDRNKGWIATSNGCIYSTNNKGDTWKNQYYSDLYELTSLYVIDSMNLFAIGMNGIILNSTDGTTWKKIDNDDKHTYNDIIFINDSTGYICGNLGILLKTINYGKSWTVTPSIIGHNIKKMFFINENVGWAIYNTDNIIDDNYIENGNIIFTTDGGKNWSLQASDSIFPALNDLYFINDSVGFIIGNEGVVIKTDNKGESWTIIIVDRQANNFTNIQFINDSIAYISNEKFIFRSNNYGISWDTVYAVDTYDRKKVSEIYIIDTNEIFLTSFIPLGWNGREIFVNYSNDGGKSYKDITKNILLKTNKNIIATKTGNIDSVLVLCAHFDAINENDFNITPGADDNATGVAAVMEAARILSQYNFKYTIKLILFDAEEIGLQGSLFFANKANYDNLDFVGALNIDMIGYDENNDGAMDIYAGGIGRSQIIGKNLVLNITKFNLNLVADYSEDEEWQYSDHAAFWKYEYPAVHILQDYEDVSPYFHSENDLTGNINFEYYHEISKLSIGTFADFALNGIHEVSITNSTSNIYSNNLIRVEEVFPNPANSIVNIPISIDNEMYIDISVYNINGDKIKSIYSGNLSAGLYNFKWNTISNDKNINSGLYLINIQTPYKQYNRKVLIQKI